MEEKQLIRQLKELAEIKPRQDWVILTKSRILAEAQETKSKAGIFSFFPIFRYKLALAPIVSVFVIIGLFGFTQSTVPGDLLFSVKKMTETAQVAFTSTTEKPKVHLQLANKRLEELGRIAQSNQVKNLDPAIKEFQANIAQAAQNLAALEVDMPGSDPMVLQEIVAEAQKLEENKEKVEAVLGTIIGDTEELENTLSLLEEQTAVYLLADLELRTLNDQGQRLLTEAKEHFEAGDYASALEKIWLLSNK